MPVGPFDADFASVAVPDLMDLFAATAASYLSPAGVLTNGLRAVLERNDTVEVRSLDGSELRDEIDALVSVEATALTPEKHGRFSIEGEYWIIDTQPVPRGGLWDCRVKRCDAWSIGERRREG